MNWELAEHISLLAAPIYAALLHHNKARELESKEWQVEARAAAIRQARALWLQTLEAPD